MGIAYVLVAAILITLPFLLNSKIKPIRAVHIKGLILPLICAIFITCLIIFSDTAVEAASKGLKLWLDIVFPSLFPFFVASELLNGTGFIKAVGILLEPVMRPLFNVPGCGSFAFAMGITSGYPVGAKITASLRQENLLTQSEAERLLAFTNNSGPLFIVGAVSTGMFKMPQVGILLLACHIAASITVGILFRFCGKNKRQESKTRHELPQYLDTAGKTGYRNSTGQTNLLKKFRKQLSSFAAKPKTNFGTAFGEAVKHSVLTMLSIGGFIILFSVIINLLIETGAISILSSVLSVILSPAGIDKDIITALISGFFEITTGANMASVANAPLTHKLGAASMILGWAGLSVHSQVLSIISGTDISIKPYFLGKFIQGAVASLYTIIGLKIAGSHLLTAEPAFSQFFIGIPLSQNWYMYFLTSCKYLMLVLSTFILLLAVWVIVSFIFALARKTRSFMRKLL